MESQQSHRIITALAHRVETGADARQIADAIVSTWREIEAALAPVPGRQAVALLYQRSLYLAADTHPWLAGSGDGAGIPMAPDALRPAFAQRSSADAAVAGGDLLRVFHEMLASLVGPPLAERMLRFVCAPDGPAAQGLQQSTEVESPDPELTS